MKRISIIFFLIFTLLMCSCGIGSLTKTSQEATNQFLKYISEADYAQAKAMAVDDIGADDIKTIFDNIKKQYKADISNGYSIEFSGFNSTVSLTGESSCELSGTLEIDKVSFEMYVMFVEKEDALKLSAFHLNHIDSSSIGEAI